MHTDPWLNALVSIDQDSRYIKAVVRQNNIDEGGLVCSIDCTYL